MRFCRLALAAAVLGTVGLGVETGFARDLGEARAIAIQNVRQQLAGVDLVAGPEMAEWEALRGHSRIVAGYAEQPLVVAVYAAEDPVSRRLQDAFALIPGDMLLVLPARLPRPAPARDLVAMAYADTSEKPRGSGVAAIKELVSWHAEANDVPPKLALALVQVESSYNSKATGRNGEIGLLQIKPATARKMGYKGSAQALYNPDTNLTWGMKYLGKAHHLSGGDTCGTLLRYNAGLGATRKSAGSNKFCAKVKARMAAAA